MSNLNITHYQIFDYWKTKLITHDFSVVDYVKNKHESGLCVVEDWGEPCCWGCDSFVDSLSRWDKYDDYLKSKNGLKYIWNYKKVKSKLNRCHIIARQFEVNDSPQNLFLMCEECHKESPDTKDFKMFLAWVVERRKLGQYRKPFEILDNIKKLCASFKVEYDDVLNYIHKTYSFNEKAVSNLFTKIGSHGAYYSPSSYASQFVSEYLSLNK